MAGSEMDTPIGAISTTISLKSFQTLTGMTAEQYLLAINDITVGDGAKITLEDFLTSVISHETGVVNVLEQGTDGKLLISPEEISDNSVSGDASNALTVGTDGLLFVPTAQVGQGADTDLSNLSATGEARFAIPDTIPKGTVSTGVIAMNWEEIYTASVTGSCSFSFESLSGDIKERFCEIEFTTTNASNPTLPTVGANFQWRNGIVPILSTSKGQILTFETKNGGTLIVGAYTRIGA